ncbi:MAG TPA: hypothetical protein VEC37_03870, partial [Bacillota bacterium]|nr:hypothetical protein [Bacillota bacterium]
KYVKTGSKALEITTSSDSAGGLKVISKNGWSINLNPTSNHNLSFWIYAEPVSQNYHGMKIAFKENPDSTGDYQEYWTDVNVAGQKFVADTWTKISIPLSNFTNINFEDVNCIEIGFTNQGTYYIDDIAVEP